MQRTDGTLHRTWDALQRTGGALDRTGVVLQRTGGALHRAGVALQRAGDPPDRAGGAIERSRHVLPLEPAAAHAAGPLIISGDTWNRVLIYNMYMHFLPLTTKIPNLKNSYFCTRTNLQYIM